MRGRSGRILFHRACHLPSSQGASNVMAIRIYVGNLPYTFREEEIAQLFAPYGEVYEVRLITDRDTRQSKGFGFVELASDEAARRAIAELNGMQAGDRTLTVNEARPQAERTPRRDYR